MLFSMIVVYNKSLGNKIITMVLVSKLSVNEGIESLDPLLTMMIAFVLVPRAHAQPVYINDYLLQGEAITVIDIDPSVHVRSEKTIVDVRGWVPSLANPTLRATTCMRLKQRDKALFALSLNASKEPTVII